LGASPAEAQVIAKRVPNARLVVVEEANHLVPLEKPRQVAEEMRKFLKGLSLDC
jgi:pimeloyl-ACP methyl ester carboxylesterase